MQTLLQVYHRHSRFSRAIGEKVWTFIYLIALMFSGIIIAFVKGWLLALVVFVLIPLLALAAFLWMHMIQNRLRKTSWNIGRQEEPSRHFAP